MKNEFLKSHEFKSLVAIVLSFAIVFGGVLLFAKKRSLAKASLQATVTTDITEQTYSQTDITASQTSEDNSKTTVQEKESETTDLTTKEVKPANDSAKVSDSYRQSNVRLPGISVTDQNVLQDMILHIYEYPYEFKYSQEEMYSGDFVNNHFESFDSSSSKAYSYAMEHIFTPYLALIERMEEWYGWQVVRHVRPTREEVEKGELRIDPLHKFEVSDVSGYGVIDGEYIDIMLKYIFNQTPDHSYELKDYYGNSVAYYYNGKYYYNASPGGDGSIPLILFESCQKQQDGSFVIQAQHVFTTDGDKIVERNVSFTLVTKPVEYDGQIFWTIYKIIRK